MNEKKENSLITGLTIIAIITIFTLMWAVSRQYWLAISILIVCPIIALLLNLFYQEEFDSSTTQGIVVTFLLITVFTSLLLYDNSKAKSNFQKLFVDGRIKSEMVTVDAEEGPNTYEKRGYYLVPNTENGKKRIEILNWIFDILLVGSPIVSVWVSSKIKSKENKNEKSIRRRSHHTG